MNHRIVHSSFLKSEQTLKALDALRKGCAFDTLIFSGMTVDDQTYLEAEDCVRNALYSQLETRIQAGVSPWVRKLVFCYRDLFTHPQRALDALAEIEADCPSHLDLPLRLKFWRAHLNLLLGKIEIGKRELVQIASKIPDGVWKNEMLTIRALGLYFTGRTREALTAHYECEKAIDLEPNLFLQTFDCSMAARTALKLCDPTSFEYFTQRLDASLNKKDDSRYRLRHTGYRAMIFNQLGENDTAQIHWKTGDEQLHSTESSIERGQYLVFRGMSYSLVNDLPKAKSTFELAEHELKLAGSPMIYMVELDIAKNLSAIANPATRGTNLKTTLDEAQKAFSHFSIMAATHTYPVHAMYAEAAQFCDSIIHGTRTEKTPDGRQSLVLSVIENISFSSVFAKGLSHFRLIPDFVHQVTESDLSVEALQAAIASVLKIKPDLVEERFRLSGALQRIESEPEVKTILDFASSLYALGEKAKELFKAKSRLREAVKTKTLLHDVRFYSQELSKLSKLHDPTINLSKLSEQLSHFIESQLQSINNGENPNQPTIVHFPTLLNQVVKTTAQITGKTAELPTQRPLPFLWVSEVLLKRLLINLVKNGIEAGTGTKPVSISYKIEEFNHLERLVVYVSDNGSGIDPSLIESLLNNDDIGLQSNKESGIGLGLRSALECAKGLGAEISIVPTTRSSGTTFRVCLPLPRQSMKSTIPEILVIDDCEAVRHAWTKFGSTERIDIEAIYGEEAVAELNHLSKETTWVVLDYDLKLPNCTGADLAPSIMGLQVKTALSTGFLETELPSEVLEIRWNAILTKEPQYPVESDRKLAPSVSIQNPTQITHAIESISEMRHEIKNELTPLRIAVKALTKRQPDDPHVKLIACALTGLEKITKQKETTL